MRLIDRSIRPLFPKGFRQEVQVMSRVFGYDGESPADILAMIASFAALHISNIPFECALGAIRIGKLNGSLTSMPGAGMNDPNRYRASMSSVNIILFRRSGTLNMFGRVLSTSAPRGRAAVGYRLVRTLPWAGGRLPPTQ